MLVLQASWMSIRPGDGKWVQGECAYVSPVYPGYNLSFDMQCCIVQSASLFFWSDLTMYKKMFILIGMLVLLPGSSRADDSYHYKVIATEFADSYRHFIPASYALDVPFPVDDAIVKVMFKAVSSYLDGRSSIFAPEVKKLFPDQYSFQLLGFVSNGRRLVLINAYLKDGKDEIESRAFIAFDGGCGYVRMFYDVEMDSILELECNGEA